MWPPPPTDDEQRAVLGVLVTGRFTDGPWTEQVEQEMIDLTGARHAVAFSSCTAAIHAVLAARDVTVGTPVAAPAWTFAGTWTGAQHLGATPEFLDVDPDTHTLTADTEPSAEHVIAVDLHGVPHGMPRANVITDACQALGTYPAAAGGTTCWSFSAAKAIPTPGGGAVTTDDPNEAARLRRLRDYGVTPGEDRAVGNVDDPAGHNWRMSEVDAALATLRLRTYPERWWPVMRDVGQTLRAAAEHAGFSVQHAPPDAQVAWHKIRIGAPTFVNALILALSRYAIPCHRWGRPLSTMSAFGPAQPTPVSCDLFAYTVCLGTERQPPWTWSNDLLCHVIDALPRVAATLETS